MRKLSYITLLSLVLAPTALGQFSLFESSERKFLPVDEAFQLTVDRRDGKLEIRWFVLPGYYLYRKSVGFELREGVKLQARLPDGVEKDDEFFGPTEVYYEELLVSLPLKNLQDPNESLLIRYQGCAEAGYCYPPQKRQLNVANMQLK